MMTVREYKTGPGARKPGRPGPCATQAWIMEQCRPGRVACAASAMPTVHVLRLHFAFQLDNPEKYLGRGTALSGEPTVEIVGRDVKDQGDLPVAVVVDHIADGFYVEISVSHHAKDPQAPCQGDTQPTGLPPTRITPNLAKDHDHEVQVAHIANFKLRAALSISGALLPCSRVSLRSDSPPLPLPIDRNRLMRLGNQQ